MKITKIQKKLASLRKKIVSSSIKFFGFTLIELMVAFTVISILSTVGLAAFVNFSKAQTVKQAASDLVVAIETARSRAISQTIPTGTTCNGFSGYSVTLDVYGSPPSYKTNILCSGNPPPSDVQMLTQKSLPSGVMFAQSLTDTSARNIIFSALTDGVSGNGSIGITASGQSMCIDVDSAGSVNQEQCVIDNPIVTPPVTGTPPTNTPTPTTGVPTNTPTPTVGVPTNTPTPTTGVPTNTPVPPTNTPTPSPTPPACTNGFRDQDGDGYGAGVTGCYTGTVSGNDTDCYDLNLSAKPGQTGWFTVQRGDGSFDYNCVNGNEKQVNPAYVYGGTGDRKTTPAQCVVATGTPYTTQATNSVCGTTICPSHSSVVRVWSNSTCTILLGNSCTSTQILGCH